MWEPQSAARPPWVDRTYSQANARCALSRIRRSALRNGVKCACTPSSVRHASLHSERSSGRCTSTAACALEFSVYALLFAGCFSVCVLVFPVCALCGCVLEFRVCALCDERKVHTDQAAVW
jgi:hypothetical protein